MLIKKHLVFKDVFLLHFTVEVTHSVREISLNPYAFFLYILLTISRCVFKIFSLYFGVINKDDNVHRFAIKEREPEQRETKSMTLWRVTRHDMKAVT